MYNPYEDNGGYVPQDERSAAPAQPQDAWNAVPTQPQDAWNAVPTQPQDTRSAAPVQPQDAWNAAPAEPVYPMQNGGYSAAQPMQKPKKAKKAKQPREGKKGFGWFLRIVAAAVIFGVFAGACFCGVNLLVECVRPEQNVSAKYPAVDRQQTQLQTKPAEENIPHTSVQVVGTDGTTVLDVTQVVADTMPAMVSINVIVTQTMQDPFGGFGSYFGFGFGFGGYEQDVPGSGSGIIIGQNDTELLIVTNNHVVGDAKQIAIEFIDGESASAYVKGTDENFDLAVVAVPLQNMQESTLESIRIAVMGDSDSLRLGEPAIAIGNALGYGQSVTVGYISALRREVKLTDGTMTLIQTDAAINPGNSGGALLNMKGEVVGINSAKYSDTDVEGMGYAIPISDGIPIINELMNSVTVPESERPYLGILGQTVPESYRSSFDWPEGVYVVEITADSPAALAGLKEGDIIVGFNGTEIKTMEALQDAIADCRVGDRAELTVMREKRDAGGGATLTEVQLSAVLIARSDAED